MTRANKKQQAGFTLLELMVSVLIFVGISGAIFGLMGQSQKTYRSESQALTSFQEARLGMDQIVRDADDAGYPAINHFSTTPTSMYAQTPVAWHPGYLAQTPCQIGTAGGGTCTTPGDFDVIFEGDFNDGNGVEWIRYLLQGTTLYRGVLAKSAGTSPWASLTVASGVMVPYVRNVMNNASSSLISTFQAEYPSMFSGGAAQPIFQFTCDSPNGPVLCQNAGTANSPANVRDIEITLIVMSAQQDMQTQRYRLVELNGRGHRKNPNQ